MKNYKFKKLVIIELQLPIIKALLDVCIVKIKFQQETATLIDFLYYIYYYNYKLEQIVGM